MPSVGSGTYSPGPNMRWSPGKEGSDGECRCHHWRCLSRSQKPCYSVAKRAFFILDAKSSQAYDAARSHELYQTPAHHRAILTEPNCSAACCLFSSNSES